MMLGLLALMADTYRPGLLVPLLSLALDPRTPPDAGTFVQPN